MSNAKDILRYLLLSKSIFRTKNVNNITTPDSRALILGVPIALDRAACIEMIKGRKRILAA